MSNAAPNAEARLRAGDRTRERLYTAAIDEFKRVGFERASVARIAARAGVSRPSFYFHFPTKSHVLLELQRRMEVDIIDGIAGRRTLRAAMRGFVDELIAAQADLCDDALFRDMVRVHMRADDIDLASQPLLIVGELARRFAAGADKGELRAGLDPENAATLFLTSVFGYILAAEETPASRRRADLETLVSLYLPEARS